jgi:hypothetical protein
MWMDMAAFFSHFSTNNESQDNCNGDKCIFTAPAGCNFAYHTNQAPWINLIMPILNVQVNKNLNQGVYDATFSDNTNFVINCSHDKGEPVNWNICKVVQQN